MPGRRTTPLFDLINKGPTATPSADRSAPARPSSKPVVRVELKPREPSYAPEAAPVVHGNRIPANVIYIGAAAMVVVIVIGIVIGVNIGSSRAKKELGDSFRRPAPSISEPTETPAPVGRTPVTRTPDNRQTSPDQGIIQSLPLTTGADPRQVGLNYLYLATLPQKDAEDAVNFLRSNNVDAYFVPFDPKGESANNPAPGGKYQVFVLPGLTAQQYGTSEKAKLEAVVLALGQQWQRERHGSSDFKRFTWIKSR